MTAPSAGRKTSGNDIVLSPQEPLVAGGRAEELERRIQTIFKEGFSHVVVDMRRVPIVDSAGVRALVRGHTTSQRLGSRFTLVAPPPAVLDTLRGLKLDEVFKIAPSLEVARTGPVSWSRVVAGLTVALVGGGLVAVGLMFPGIAGGAGAPEANPFGAAAADGGVSLHPLYELSKLVVAAIVGMLVTSVHRQYRSDTQPNPGMDQAQVLLCISGAMMMIIIGNSLARAFGIAGAASIVRFRTPVDDARDITVLFLLMGLGMAAGLGNFAVAGLGTLFLCAMFPVLSYFSQDRPRHMQIEIAAAGREFPIAHVQRVFALNRVVFEPREVSQGDASTVKYVTTLKPSDSLEDLSAQLMADPGVANVSWSTPKR
jgi:anti-anti-sigma factor